ncbi:MAG: hypothetical protein H7328_02495 [Bdellovibrio sp.]|nr:hypothetical protein [Bdellovibrio sp.]
MKRILPIIATVFSSATLFAAAPSTSLSTKMTEFSMPPGYECPLFSNSPYGDMLTALDKMQDNLNKVFQQCGNKIEDTKTIQTANELRNKIFDAQKMQSSGQTFKLNSTADAIVTLTTHLQKSLVSLAASKTSACYQSESQFRSVIFSINDTFQSMAPLVIDLVSKNPGLAQSLGPAVKIFAGADAISKSLTLIEQIAKDSIQFDMTDPELRLNTVKNICQFMKLYNRLDSLRLYRLGQIQSVSEKFVAEIKEKNAKVDELKRSLSIKPKSGIGAEGATYMFSRIEGDDDLSSSEGKVRLFSELKSGLADQQNKVKLAIDIFESSKQKDQIPEISQCQVILSTLANSTLTQYKEKVEKFANAVGDRSDYRLQLDILKAYEDDIRAATKTSDRNLCAKLGYDLLNKLGVFLDSSAGILANFENRMISEKGEFYVFQAQELKTKEIEAKAIESNYANLKTMLNYASFESSEVEKRAKGIYKYLFAGPDKVESDCKNRVEKEKCDLADGIAGIAKAYYQEYRNQGPVYELILNNELYFKSAYSEMLKAITKVQKYEDQFVAAPKSTSHVSREVFNDYIERRQKNAFEMPHISLKYLVKGTSAHTVMCLDLNNAVEQYAVAATHMMSSVGLCEIIKNVLSQPKVSEKLKSYCLPLNDQVASGINNMRFKMMGEFDGTTTAREGNITRSFARAPRTFVESLQVKVIELGCRK